MLAAALGAGCAAAPPPRQAPAPLPSSPARLAAVQEPAEEPPESEAERQQRIAGAKREGCQQLARAMASRGQDVLLNVHNGATLVAMGGELDESADLVDGVRISGEDLPPLAELRSRYTSTTRAMAKALFTTAEAAGFEERKAPLRQFRELEPQLRELLVELTEYCSS